MNKKIQVFEVKNFPWDENGYRPQTIAELSYDESGYQLHLKSYETELRMEVTNHNGCVWCDSCMEMFAQFAPDSDKNYINFEINPNGAMVCAIGACREDRISFAADEIGKLNPRTVINADSWEAWIDIPVDFIKKSIPSYTHEEGHKIKANFYKCGDETKYMHFGCWNNIIWQQPDFHRPEFFGEITL